MFIKMNSTLAIGSELFIIMNDMEPLSAREIQVLDILREDQKVSQRGLAKRMDVALGLANALLKQLVQKGYVNVIRTDAHHFAYLCTPQGMAQKTVRLLTHLENSFEFYQQAKRIVRHSVSEIERRGLKRVAIYGKGDIGEMVYVALKDFGLDVAALLDDECPGERWLGQEVLSVEGAKRLGLDAVVVAAAEPPLALVEDLRERLGCPVLRLAGEEAAC